MAIDKKLRIFDAQGNEQDYDIMATDVKFLPDGKDLPTKLAEMEQEIGEAGQVNEIIMNGQHYTPTNKVIDLGTVITQHQDISGKVDKVTGKGLSTNDFTAALKAKLEGLDPYTKAQVDELIAAASSGAVSFTTSEDGTFTAHVGDTDYTINLNHTHENMAKVVVCEESDLPSTLDKDTIYAQVDDAETPTEIQSLWIAGLEFVGGGGVDPTIPALTSPTDASTIRFDNIISPATSVEKTIRVKGTRALTEALTATLDGTGYTFGQTQPSGVTRTDGTHLTITAVAVKAGVNIVIVSSNTAENATGTLTIASTEVGCECTLLTPNVSYEDLTAVVFGNPSSPSYVETDYNINQKSLVVADVALVDNGHKSGGYISFGTKKRNLDNDGTFFVYATSTSASQLAALVGSGAGTRAGKFMEPYGRFTLILGCGNFTIKQGEQVLASETTNATPSFISCLTIGGGYESNNKGIPLEYYQLNVYNFKIYERDEVGGEPVDTLVHEYIPRKKNGVVGLYDVKTGTFFGSANENAIGFIS